MGGSARAQAVRTVGRAKVQAGEVPEVLAGGQMMKNEVQAGNDTHRMLSFLIRLRTLYLAIFTSENEFQLRWRGFFIMRKSTSLTGEEKNPICTPLAFIVQSLFECMKQHS